MNSLYSPYEELEKSEKLPHFLKFMGNHPKAQETAQWADDNLKHRNLAEFAMRHAKSKPEGLNDEEKSQVKHFSDSLHTQEVQKAAGMLSGKHDFNSGIQLLKDAESEYAKRHAAEAPKLVPTEGEKVLDFGDGVAVYNLGEDQNANEATAMGHCATPHQGGELWSIRKDHGNGMVEPLVTISHEGGYIGEMKGKHNWKPSTKHHGHIAKLFASDLIKGFVGGGYAPESNFEFSDMAEGLRKKLLDYKPSLVQKVYKETLPKGFRGDYSHTPEIKSIFSTNDVEAQIKYLKKYKKNSSVHQNAAKNPNIHPDLLRHLIQVNYKGSFVHQNAAENPNTHPDDLRHLIQVNDKGSSVHQLAAQNPNIHPDLLRHLIQVNDKGSYVHRLAAKNPNIHPDDLHHLIQVNDKGSYVHQLAAENPNIHPDDLHHLIQVNDKGSSVHQLAAQNPNIHPDDLHHLIQVNDKDSWVHEKAAQNPNIHPDDLRHLIQVNDKGSYVHYFAAKNSNIHPDVLRHLIQVNDKGSDVHVNAAENPNIHPDDLHHLIQVNDKGSYVHYFAAKNPNIHPDVLRHLIQVNDKGSYVHRLAAKNPNIHPDDLHHLIQVNDKGSDVHQNAAGNPQFKNLPPEIQQIVNPPRPFEKENIQKLISIMNDEKNPQLARQAHQEIQQRRKEKYDKILSSEGNIDDIKHLAESHDEEISKRAREELKRRGLQKSLKKSQPLNKVLVSDEPSQIEKIAKYDGMRPNEQLISTTNVPHPRFGSVYIHHFSSDEGTNSRHLVSLFHDPTKEGVSILMAARQNEDEPMTVYGAATKPEFRGHKLNYFALREAVKSHRTLHSDVLQTKAAFKNWADLQKEAGFKVNLTKPFRKGSSEDASLLPHIAQYNPALLRRSEDMDKALTPEQQKQNIKKQRQLKNKEIIAKLKSRVVEKEPSTPKIQPHLLMSEDDSPYGIPVYLKTHKDHDSLAGVHVHVDKLPELKNYGLLNHPEIDKALDRAEERGHEAVYVNASSKPTIEVRPHPEDVADVDPEILESMKDRLKSQKPKSHLKLIKALWSSAPKVVNGQYAKPFSMGGTKKEKKTIYSHFSHPEHAKFNAQEHLDAYWRHHEKIKQNPKMEPSLVNFHKQQAQMHWDKSKELVDRHDTSRQIQPKP